MRRKIAIRRVGALIPALCLVAVLFLCISIIWLSTAGFPGFVLRMIEQEAAKEGIALKLEDLKLEPTKGLSFSTRNAHLYTSAEAADPIATIPSLSVGINVTKLLTGTLKLDHIQLQEASIPLPVTDTPDEKLLIKDLSFSARISNRGRVRITSGKLNVQGIPITVGGDFSLPEGGESEKEAEPVDLAALLEDYAEYIDTAYHYIREQQWKDGEIPHLDLQISTRDHFSLSLKANVPRCNIANYTLHDGTADLAYQENTVIINTLNFRFSEPHSTFSLQGGYDLEQRLLSFSLNSTAPPLHFIKKARDGSQLAPWLSKIRAEPSQNPHISLKGDIRFEPDFSLKDAAVVGSVEQHHLHIGDTTIEQLDLSFFYNNGDFNINRLHLQFPEGWLELSARAKDTSGEAGLEADLPVDQTLSFINEFTPTPICLPEGLELEGNLKLSAQARLRTTAFKPGQTDWQDFVPTINQASLKLSIGKVHFLSQEWTDPSFSISLNGIWQTENLIPSYAQAADLALSAEQIRLAFPESDPLILQGTSLNLALKDLKLCLPDPIFPISYSSLSAGMQMAQANYGKTEIQGLAFQVSTAPSSIDLSEGDGADGEATNGRATDGGDATFIGKGEAALTVQQLTHGEIHTTGISFDLLSYGKMHPLADWRNIAEQCDVRLCAQQLDYQGQDLGQFELKAEKNWQRSGAVMLAMKTSEGQDTVSLSVEPDWSDPAELLLENIKLSAKPLPLEPVLENMGFSTKEIRLPDTLELTDGKIVLSLQEGTLDTASFTLNIPRLVRTPYTNKVFEGKEIPVSLAAQASLSQQKDGNIRYRANVEISHESGMFQGTVAGESRGKISVMGASSIDLKAMDALIDDDEAHEIIRDFRTYPESKTLVSDLSADIDYSNGIQVHLSCNPRLEKMDYMLGAIEQTQEGQERLDPELVRELGSDPYTSFNLCTTKLVADYAKRVVLHGKEQPLKSEIHLSGIHLEYNNRPWLARHDFSSVANNQEQAHTSTLTADGVTIDIAGDYVEVRNVRGTIYPAYSFGMFYPDLEGYMKDMLLPSPVPVESNTCLFPIGSACTRPMSGTIRMECPGKAGFRFLGTTIPLERFSGFVYLNDDYVYLDRLNAKCWGGVLNAAVNIGIAGKTTSFDGYATAENMDLHRIAASYGSKQEYALCNANFRFRSPSSKLADIEGYGEGTISNGDLLKLQLFRPVGDLISDIPGHLTDLENKAQAERAKKPGLFSRAATNLFKSTGSLVNKVGTGFDQTTKNVPFINHILAYNLQDAYIRFTLIHGHLATESLKAKGCNLSVAANLDIDLDSLEISGNLWPKISSLPTIILSPLTFLSDFMIDIVVYGKTDDIKWKFSLDRRLQNDEPSLTDAPGDPAYQPAPQRKPR